MDMDQLLNQFKTLRQAEPPANLEDRIWQAVLSQKNQSLSPLKVALAACCIGVILFVEINLATSGRTNETKQVKNEFGLTTDYDLYHE